MSIPTHTAVAIIAKGSIDEIRLPTQKPQEDDVLVKVQYCAAISLDAKMADSGYLVENYPLPLGLNGSGLVVDVGPGVHNLKIGDRVATVAPGFNPVTRAMQEYCLLPKYYVSKIPDHMTLAEAATVPDNFVTAYWTLFHTLPLPQPTSLPETSPPPEASTPILIYGSGTTVGQFIIQTLRLAGYTQILTTASTKHHSYLVSLGATKTFDYSNPDLAHNILAATGGNPLKYVVDCVTSKSTLQQIGKIVKKGSIVATLIPTKDEIDFPDGVKIVGTWVFDFVQERNVRETLLPIILPKLLAGDDLKPNRVRLIQEGTFKQRAETALDLFRRNRVSGEKIIVQIPYSSDGV